VEQDIEFILGDVRDAELLNILAKHHDYIIHHAALVSVPLSVEDPLTTHEVNITGTLNVLNAARKAGIKKVVCAASSAVYGNNKILPKKEDFYPAPLTPYAVSKYSGELYLRLFAQLYHIQTVGFRYFNVYGPRQNPKSHYAAVIPKFITQLLRNEQPVIYGDGEQTRDFIYVDDVVNANLLAIRSTKLSGEIFNIASGCSISINKIYLLISNLLDTNLEPLYENKRIGDVKNSLADIMLAKNLLDFYPQNDLETGLKSTINWYVDVWMKHNRSDKKIVI
jgi:nucleoside-diphosphate-sugar epimerase